jgi:hypothetical protein
MSFQVMSCHVRPFMSCVACLCSGSGSHTYVQQHAAASSYASSVASSADSTITDTLFFQPFDADAEEYVTKAIEQDLLQEQFAKQPLIHQPPLLFQPPLTLQHLIPLPTMIHAPPFPSEKNPDAATCLFQFVTQHRSSHHDHTPVWWTTSADTDASIRPLVPNDAPGSPFYSRMVSSSALNNTSCHC